jgi:hypothetical protein
MSEQRTLYVAVNYKDPHGRDHSRGDKVTANVSDPVANELLYRGILSETPVRRQAGENSSRVTGDQEK